VRRARAARGPLAAALVLLALAPGGAGAHELRPALLAIDEIAPGEYRVALHRSLEVGFQETIEPIFPPGTERLGQPEHVRAMGQSIDRLRVRIPGGWEGKAVAVRRAGLTTGEVLVRVETRAGRAFTGRLMPGGSPWVMPRQPGPLAVAGAYLGLGVEHILTGLDHLAFVLGLVLLTPAWRNLWKSVTAFTLAHSLTLVLATLGVLHVPQPPVEAVIALSILFVAREVVVAAIGRPSATARRPWPLAFTFGLLHGLGFAGALADVGLPRTDLPVALLTFNVGVELGQLAFVVVLLLLRAPLARLAARLPARARLAPGYALGAMAFFWCLQRITSFWT
jgi:hydrogenase/urease accessory protein HupE